MASVVGKTIKGNTYYYLATSARVEGKPRIAEQTYLGTAAEIAQAMAGATRMPTRSRHLAFGDLAAAWHVIEKLGVVEIVDEVAGPRRADAGASVGTYLALATLNRVVDPCSKSAFADWWAGTAGDRLLDVPPAALDSRRHWDATRQLDAPALAEIERRIALRAVTAFELDISSLALDMTNFASFIDSTNTRASLAQRGKAKQKRFDLRLVGLGLVVTRDGGIPLLSHTYPGNKTDVTQFATMIDELSRRHRALGAAPGALTVVFDAGQNSEPNFAKLTEAQLHYVGSLPPSDHPDLLAIPHTDYHPIAEFDRLRAHDRSVETLGLTHRCVLTHSEELHAGQSRGLDQTLAKAGRELDGIKDVLARGRARRSRTQLEATIDKIVNKQYVRDVLTCTLTGDTPTRHPAGLADRPHRPRRPGRPRLRQTVPHHRPPRLDRPRSHRRLPLPIRGRVRVPPTQRPPRGLLQPHVPPHRRADPRPRVLLRPGADDRAPHPPASRPRRHQTLRTRVA